MSGAALEATVERKSMDGAAAAMMVLLCALLGLHQVAIKAAAHDIAPIVQIALRSGLSALLVFVFVVCRGERYTLRDGTLVPGLLVGCVFSLEFLLVAEGLRFTSASHMSLFLYTAPIFTSLALHRMIPAERLCRHQWFGVVIAFLGIVLAFAGGAVKTGITPKVLFGDFLAVSGGAAWAATTVMIRCSRLADAPPTKTLLYQLVAAFVLLLLYGAVTGQTHHFVLSPIAWTSLLFQGVVVTFAVYLVWFSMLRRYNASQLSVFLFLSPLFGVSFGVLLLKESIDVFFAIGAFLVLVGISLVSRRRPSR